MRLLSYISLKSHGKDVVDGYPLELSVEDFEIVESHCDVEFIKHIIPSLDWRALQKCAKAVNVEGLPEIFEIELLNDEDFLNFIHNLLLDIHIIKGELICPDTARKFPIINSIPNMM